jgi:subtilisin family serine protease
MPNRILHRLLISTTAALLVACGGGGGGGGDGTSSSTTSSATPSSTSTSNGNDGSSTTSLVTQTDPLLSYQWHIQNTGSSAFSSTLPVSGNDMNVTGAWNLGYSGKGIKVAIVDSGLEIAHEDLNANVDQSNSHNFLTGTNNPTPSVSGEDHGTQVAGIVGAVGFNGKGGRGVAYNATLRGYNLLASGVNTLSNIGSALGGASYSETNDIFNESFSSVYGSLPPLNSTYQAVTSQTTTLRSGKGAVLVQAAGNEFLNSSSGKCTNANNYHVSCGDPATDTRRDGYVPIIVGAFNADGVKSSYSNAGTAIWVSAPGGEFGVDSTYLPNQTSTAYKPAITTTSLTGCSNASANGFSTNTLNSLNSQGQNPNAKNCQYTAIMNGTSSAAPNASAVVALMLEANPNLTVRDVKHILAKTAKQIDSGNSGVSSSTILTGSTIVLDQGWVNNAANYWFSTWYGFGAIDATAAVSTAKSYTAYLPTVQTNSSSLHYTNATTIPHTTTGITMTFNMSQSFNTVEEVILFTNLTSTSALTCNQFELTSPSGTKSILLHAANGYSSDGVNYQSAISNARILSNAFYGESAGGNWTLRFLDFCSSGTTTFTSSDTQTLTIIGH